MLVRLNEHRPNNLVANCVSAHMLSFILFHTCNCASARFESCTHQAASQKKRASRPIAQTRDHLPICILQCNASATCVP